MVYSGLHNLTKLYGKACDPSAVEEAVENESSLGYLLFWSNPAISLRECATADTLATMMNSRIGAYIDHQQTPYPDY
jgi:hypothetical protein